MPIIRKNLQPFTGNGDGTTRVKNSFKQTNNGQSDIEFRCDSTIYLSSNEWKFLEWDEKLQTNNQKNPQYV